MTLRCYSLYPQYWGQGLAVEATTACLHHATTSLSAASVIALTRPENRRSQRVLEKVGMVLDRELLHDNIPHVLFRTRPVHQPLLRDDWR